MVVLTILGHFGPVHFPTVLRRLLSDLPLISKHFGVVADLGGRSKFWGGFSARGHWAWEEEQEESEAG